MKSGNPKLTVGGIYGTRDKDGSWKLSRVLALDDHAVHLRLYSDRFTELPKDVDLKNLHWVIGHVPLARAGFENESPVLIKVVPVADDELEGYRYYLEAMKRQ